MPNWGDEFLDDLDEAELQQPQPVTPDENLLPRTEPKPQDGPLPPRKKKSTGKGLSMFGKLSINNWTPPDHVTRDLDRLADQITNQ